MSMNWWIVCVLHSPGFSEKPLDLIKTSITYNINKAKISARDRIRYGTLTSKYFPYY